MPEPAKSVVYVITTTGFGGAERQVLQLATTMRSRGWSVGVVSMLPMHEQFLALESSGVRLASLDMTAGVADPRGLVRLARLLRAWRPRVVHGHMVHGILLTRLVRLLTPVSRVVSTMHSTEQGAQWRYYAFRLTDRLAEVTTTVSEVALDETVRRRAVGSKGIHLVPNGIQTRDYAEDPELRASTRSALGLDRRFTFLTVGRLAPVKRQTDLLTAMRIVKQDVPSVQLLIAGKGPLEPALRRQIAQDDLEQHVSMLGLRRDVRALMQAADGFVMSSAWEGLPMVLLEAAASSLPAVVTDVGGSRDVIVEGETGLLSPALDPPALATEMLRLVRMEPMARRRMGLRAMERATRSFDIERVADRWEELYRGR